MKFSLCVVLSVVFAILFEEAISQTVTCETIKIKDWSRGLFKTCFMKETSINSDEFVISAASSTIQAIDFYGNKNIQFLPIQLDETFPNVVLYIADWCSIKTVSKENLKNLTELKYLDLGGNQLERIRSDTFEDLTSLEQLDLNNNKIKEINGAAFRGSVRLTKVWLRFNVCIDRDYLTPTAIAILILEASKNCGFTEVEATTENSSNVSPSAVQSLNVSMVELMKENRECLAAKLETAATMTAENMDLKSQLKASEDTKLGHQAEISDLKLQLQAAKSSSRCMFNHQKYKNVQLYAIICIYMFVFAVYAQ